MVMKLNCIVVALILGLVLFNYPGEAHEDRHNELRYKTNIGDSSSQQLVNKRTTRQDDQDNKIPDQPSKLNGTNEKFDDRIVLVEPYKSIIQTTTRFALAQSKITKHLNVDTAMNLLNDAGYLLSRPAVLLKTLKFVAVTLATLMATIFFFPGAHKFAENVWEDPTNALNLDRYLTNGLEERSVLAALGSKTEETLARVGQQDSSCRQRSLCHMGAIIKCTFPHTTDTVTKFVSDNFSSSSMKENLYARAFISGFVNGNCTGVGVQDPHESQQNCLGNLFYAILNASNESKFGSRRRK